MSRLIALIAGSTLLLCPLAMRAAHSQSSASGPRAILTSDLSDGFFERLRSVCDNLRCDPIDLLKVMMSESGVRAGAAQPEWPREWPHPDHAGQPPGSRLEGGP